MHYFLTIAVDQLHHLEPLAAMHPTKLFDPAWSVIEYENYRAVNLTVVHLFEPDPSVWSCSQDVLFSHLKPDLLLPTALVISQSLLAVDYHSTPGIRPEYFQCDQSVCVAPVPDVES